MLQQNKENREIRKLSKERMKEHHKYLVNKGKNKRLSDRPQILHQPKRTPMGSLLR